MKKIIGLIAALTGLGLSNVCAAQMTTVSATSITDSDGTLWANGTVAIQFVPNPATPNPGAYKICSSGAALNPAVLNQAPVSLAGAGGFSASVYDNSQVCPQGSQWQFTVCPNASSKCGIITVPISGATQDITTQVNTLIPAPRFAAIANNFGYADVEAQLQLTPGGLYYNVADLCYRQFSGSTFSCLGAGNPFTIPIPINQGGTGEATQTAAFQNIVTPGGFGGANGAAAKTALLNLGGLSNVQTTPQVTVSALNGVWPSSFFGVTCNGSTDDSTALNSIGTFVAAQPAGSTVTVLFPSNATCVHASEITGWVVSNLHIDGNGSRLKFTGTGTSTNGQIYLHGTSTSQEIDNLWIQGLVLQGNANSTWGVYQDNGTIARSKLEFVNVQDQNTGCYNLTSYQVNITTTLVCSSQLASIMGTPQITTPNIGASLGSTSPLGFFANNRIVNMTIEGVKVTGIDCVVCTNGNHFFGTAEGTTSSSGSVGVGLIDNTAGNGQGNTFSLDLESNAVADAQIEGLGETFLNTVSLGTFTVLSGGVVDIWGGEYQQITLASGHIANIVGIVYNSLQTTGTVSGNTATDCLINVLNRVGGANTTTCMSGIYLPLSGGAVTGSLTVSGTIATGSATTASSAPGDAILPNGNFLRGANSINNTTIPLIGANAASQIVIGASGQPLVYGASAIPIPIGSTGTQVVGQVACVKSITPLTLGTCSGTVNASTGACGTCN
jgi:hypothetical protein